MNNKDNRKPLEWGIMPDKPGSYWLRQKYIRRDFIVEINRSMIFRANSGRLTVAKAIEIGHVFAGPVLHPDGKDYPYN